MAAFFTDASTANLFAEMDVDKDGTISFSELQDKILEYYPAMPKAVITEIMVQADKDGNGELDIDEFSAMIRASPLMTKICHNVHQFHSWDTDNDQTLTKAEIKQNLEVPLADAVLEDIMQAVDDDKNGVLSAVEFLAFRSYLGEGWGIGFRV